MTLRKFLRRLFGRPRKFIPMSNDPLHLRVFKANVQKTTMGKR